MGELGPGRPGGPQWRLPQVRSSVSHVAAGGPAVLDPLRSGTDGLPEMGEPCTGTISRKQSPRTNRHPSSRQPGGGAHLSGSRIPPPMPPQSPSNEASPWPRGGAGAPAWPPMNPSRPLQPPAPGDAEPDEQAGCAAERKSRPWLLWPLPALDGALARPDPQGEVLHGGALQPHPGGTWWKANARWTGHWPPEGGET